MYIVYYSVYCDYFGVFIEQYVQRSKLMPARMPRAGKFGKGSLSTCPSGRLAPSPWARL